MGGAPLVLVIATLGIDYGYQPDGADGLEYIVQVPAELLRQGTTSFESSIDPQLRPFITKVIVRCGNDRLPRNDGGLLSRMKTGRSGNDKLDVLPPNPADSEHQVTRPIPIKNLEPDTMPVPIPSLVDPSVITVSNRPQADGGMVLPGVNPDRNILPNPSFNNTPQSNSLRDIGNQLNQPAHQIQNHARDSAGGLFQQNREQHAPYTDANAPNLQGTQNYTTQNLSLGSANTTTLPSFGQTQSQLSNLHEDQKWRVGNSLPSTEPVEPIGRYSGMAIGGNAPLGNGVYPTENGSVYPYFNTPDPRSVGNQNQQTPFGPQFRDNNLGSTFGGNGGSVLPNSLTSGYQRQASLPNNLRFDSGFGNPNTLTNNQNQVLPSHDFQDSGYPARNYLGYGRTNFANVPVSRKFLDVLLLCSVIANAYLLIGLSSLLSKYRNLVANVRGVNMTSQTT